MKTYSFEQTLLVEIINRLQRLLKRDRIIRCMQVQDIHLARIQRLQTLPKLLWQILSIKATIVEGENLCRDLQMGGGNLGENDFTIAIAVEASSVDFDVTVGMEGGEEGGDGGGTTDFAGGC